MPFQIAAISYRHKWSILLNLPQVQNVVTFSIKVYIQMVATFPSQMVVTFPSQMVATSPNYLVATFPSQMVATFSRFLFGPFKVILLYDMIVTYDITKFYPKFHKHYILKVKIYFRFMVFDHKLIGLYFISDTLDMIWYNHHHCITSWLIKSIDSFPSHDLYMARSYHLLMFKVFATI